MSKYATHDGQLDISSVRARGVGNAVFIEHIGGNGDIAAIGVGTKEFANDLAGELNAIFNSFRSALADAARTSGEFANAMWIRVHALEEQLRAKQ